MKKYLLLLGSINLWISLTLGVLVTGGDGVENTGIVQKNGWQPLITSQDHNPSNIHSNNYAIFRGQPDKEDIYKPKQHRRQHESLDYNPLSVLGSFSIFGHVLPKNRDGDEVKAAQRHEPGINKNEYDFLVPPPRQKIESYQKLKLPGDPYGGPSHYRDIYTPINTQITFIPTNPASPGPMKKHPPLHADQYQKYPPWSQNPHPEPYRVNNFRQHPPHIDANRYYTQIGHPPTHFHASTEQSNKVIPPDYSTHKPILSYPTSAVPPPRNEFISGKPIDPQHGNRQNFHYEHQNAPVKQQIDGQSFVHNNSPFSEVLPKINKPTQFQQNTRVIPEKIHPIVQKTPYETPESISLKHFNEQQYLLQQQLLERDRQKLEELRNQQKLQQKPIVLQELTTAKVNYDDGFYESVKLTNEMKSSTKMSTPAPIVTKIYDDYRPKHHEEYERKKIVTTTENYHFENVHNENLEQSGSSKFYGHINRERVTSEVPIEVDFDTTPAPIRSSTVLKIYETTTTTESPSLPPAPSASTIEQEFVTNTARKPTIKTRGPSRGPTRRRKPVLSTENILTSSSTSVEPTFTSNSKPQTSIYENTLHFHVSTEPNTSTIQTSSNPTKFSTFAEAQEEYVSSTQYIPSKSEDLTTLGTYPDNLITGEVDTSSVKPTTAHADNVVSISHLSTNLGSYPEEMTTHTTAPTTTRQTTRSSTRSTLRRTTTAPTTQDYSYSIEPLEHLFNLTDSLDTKESITINKINKNHMEITTAPVEMTTRPTYRIRPMKMGNNTRPRFSVKDYKSRLDYRNRMSQNLTTESTPSATAVSMKVKAKYKYTPRVSYSKIKTTTPSTLNKITTNSTDMKKSKMPTHRPFNYRYRGNNYSNDNNSTDLNPVMIKHNKFNHTRRPLLRPSSQVMKKNKPILEMELITTENSVTEVLPIETQTVQINSPEINTDNLMEMEVSKDDDTLIDSHDTVKLEDVEMSELITEAPQQSSIQSDEEAFAKASQSVADLTSSASALYNQPGMFKALSTVSAFNNNHRKFSTPSMDEPALPIETFFRELSSKE